MTLSDDNPFATGASGSPLGTPAEIGDGTLPVELEFGAIAARVFENVLRFPMETAVPAVILIGVALVMVPVGMVFRVVAGNTVAALGLPPEVADLGSSVLSLAQALLSTLLMVGAYRMFLTGVRGGKPELSMLVGELWAVLKLMVANLLVTMATSVLFIPAVGAGVAWYYGHLPPLGALAVAGLNVALVMPVSLTIGVFTQFLGVVLVDQQLGPVAALGECVRVTRGGRLLAGAFLVLFVVTTFVVSLVTCGFGAPLVQVLGGWVHVVMYRALVAVNGRAPGSMVTEPV